MTSFNSLHMLGKTLGFVPRGGPSNVDASTDNSDNQNPITIMSGVMTFSTGIFLTGARLLEPLFRVLIWQKLYEFWGKIYEPKLKDADSIDELKKQDKALN